MVTVKRFTAEWCQPCKVLAPMLEAMRSDFNQGNVTFVTIDVDKDKKQAQAYGIASVPTIVIEKDGNQVARIVGLKPRSSYITEITRAL